MEATDSASLRDVTRAGGIAASPSGGTEADRIFNHSMTAAATMGAMTTESRVAGGWPALPPAEALCGGSPDAFHRKVEIEADARFCKEDSKRTDCPWWVLPDVPVVVDKEGRKVVEPAAEEGEPTATTATADGIELGGWRASRVRIR